MVKKKETDLRQHVLRMLRTYKVGIFFLNKQIMLFHISLAFALHSITYL